MRFSLDLGDAFLKFLFAGLSVLGKIYASRLMTSFPPMPPHLICFSLLQCARSRSLRPIQPSVAALYHIIANAFPMPFLLCVCLLSSLAALFTHFSLSCICPFSLLSRPWFDKFDDMYRFYASSIRYATCLSVLDTWGPRSCSDRPVLGRQSAEIGSFSS